MVVWLLIFGILLPSAPAGVELGTTGSRYLELLNLGIQLTRPTTTGRGMVWLKSCRLASWISSLDF